MKALKNEYWIKMSVEMLRSTTRDRSIGLVLQNVKSELVHFHFMKTKKAG